MTRIDFPDWQAWAACEARDEQRRHPLPYPLTRRERLESEFTPDSEPAWWNETNEPKEIA